MLDPAGGREGTRDRAAGLGQRAQLAIEDDAPAGRAALVDRQQHGTVASRRPSPAASSTSRICPPTDGPPGSRPSKIAPPMVNPHAPAASSAWICATLATDPAAITGPLDACTTARVSSATSAVGCR